MKYRYHNRIKGLVSFFLLVAGIMISTGCLYGQFGPRGHIRAGNRAYNNGDLIKAEEHYRKSLGTGGGSLHGHFNLGNSLYKQKKFEDASDQYRLLSGREYDSITMGSVYYNLGNSLIQRYFSATADENPASRGQFLKEGIDAYCQALRFNPRDEDARHNLTLALQLRNSSPPRQWNPEQQHEQDKKKQEQPLPETKISEEEQDQEIPEHEEGRISREDAERMLNAIREKEMKTAGQIHARERTRKEKGKLKDW